jgi:hypothetical protein
VTPYLSLRRSSTITADATVTSIGRSGRGAALSPEPREPQPAGRGFSGQRQKRRTSASLAPVGPSEPRQPLIFVMLTKNEREERNRQLSDRCHRARGLRPTYSLLCGRPGQRYPCSPLSTPSRGDSRGDEPQYDQKNPYNHVVIGGPDTTRTCDLRLRRDKR